MLPVKKLGTLWAFIIGWLFVMIALAFFVQVRDYHGNNLILRQRLEVMEAFQGAGPPPVTGVQDPSVRSVAPADATLDQPRVPYNLLNGWLPPREKPLYPTAQRCHEVDFQGRLEKTGNFRQLTNNYKRGDPDSCSGAPEEMTLAFYDVKPLPQAGCLGGAEL